MKLKISDLIFAYSSVPVLNDLCMEVVRSEILGIVGPNGSGKSTFIKCIDNILEPVGGDILLEGEDIRRMNRLEIARNIGYVPQVSSRTFSDTVFETVLMGRRPYMGWRGSEEDLDKVAEILELLGLEAFALRHMGELSGGQQQKVLIARALAQEAGLLVLDEPTANLDMRHQIEVMEIIGGLARDKGCSVIVVLHDLNLASRFSDRIIMLKKGRIFAAGSPEETLTTENIRNVYGVEAVVNHDSRRPHVIPVGLSEGDFKE